jgi:tight adherence protein B
MEQELTIFFWLGTVFMGLATVVAGFSARGHLREAFEWVERDLAEKLRRLHAPAPGLRSWLIVWLMMMGASFFLFWFLLGNMVFAVLVCVSVLAGPWYLIRRMAEQRRQKIEEQLADSMVTLASAVKAGLSLSQALEILAAQCPQPIQSEFQQMMGEYKLGKPLERVLIEAKGRLRSENFALFAAALLAAHESGGRLNETVERIAQSVLELERLERKVLSETAQARKSAVYMAIAPLFILTVYWFVDPVNTRLLFTQLAGQVLLGIAAVLDVTAYLWARMILRPDI